MTDPLPPYEDIDPNLPTDELAIRFGDGSWEYIMKAETRTINGERRIVVIFPLSDKFLTARGIGTKWKNEKMTGDYVKDRKSDELYRRKHYPIEFISFPEYGHKMYNCKLTFEGDTTEESEEPNKMRTKLDNKERENRDLRNELLEVITRKGLVSDDEIKRLKKMGFLPDNPQTQGGTR